MPAQRVLMAMSGGVDSSVAALLLQRQGYEVVGATMRLCAAADDSNLTDIEDARQVAHSLGIEHHVLDFSADFEREVIDRFCQGYFEGRTPNPCIDCNRFLKFGLLHQSRIQLGCDYLATGHYARIQQDAGGTFHLLKAVNSRKDQSYVLYHLTQQTMAHTLLPLGALTKEQTRELAAEAGLSVAEKGESQDICFVPGDDYAGYIEQRSGRVFEPGPVTGPDGSVMGQHLGLGRYTIGQRRGLNLGGGMDPLYVTGKDAQTNTLRVGPAGALQVQTMCAADVSFTGAALEGEVEVQAKAGYRMTPAPARAAYADGQITVEFTEPVRATSPGQSLVLYSQDEVLGGGIIV